MSDPLDSHLDQTGVVLSCLVACIVQTFDESDVTFQPLFLKHLDVMYQKMRTSPMAGTPVLESLMLVKDLIRR